MAVNTPAVFYRGNPQYGATNVARAVTTAALTSNLVTLTLASNHGLTQVGSLISVQGVGASYDGLFPVNSYPGLNQVTYVVTSANISSASVTPNGSAIINTGVTVGGAISNQAIVNYTAIISTSAAHGLAIGDIVRVNTGATGVDGTWVVTSTPSTNIFTFASNVQTLASAAVSQGTFGKFPSNYTVPASTTAIATNVIFTNPTNSTALVSFTIGNVAVLKQLQMSPNTTTLLDIKQYMNTGQSLTVATNERTIDCHVSGMTIV